MKAMKNIALFVLALLLLTGCAPAAQSPAPAETQQTAEPQAAAAEEGSHRQPDWHGAALRVDDSAGIQGRLDPDGTLR